MWNEGLAAAARRRMAKRDREEEREGCQKEEEAGGKENVGLVGKPASGSGNLKTGDRLAGSRGEQDKG